MIGDIINLQSIIGRSGRDEEIEDYVGTICGGIRTENNVSRQSDSLYLQAKEVMDKINSGSISETDVIKAEIQTTMAMVEKINQDQRRQISPLKN